MATAKDITDSLIARAKKAQKFIIIRHLDDPDIIMNCGVVPFDLTANREGRLSVTVYAQTLEEAEDQVDTWLRELEEGDDL